MFNKEILDTIERFHPAEGMQYLAARFPGKVVFSTSLGQEDQVLTDMIARHAIGVQIFTLDTGRLFNETIELLDKTIARYKLPVQVFYPDTKAVEDYVNTNGINAFYESPELRRQCCQVRKVEPLNRALRGAKVWITGLRAEQSVNRQAMPVLEWDEERQLYKYNPLLHWTYAQLTDYIDQNNVPCNVLHSRGFLSIGCAPCTRAVEPGEDARAGRWWWETSHKECGLHQTVVK